jgi:hypothetical protein
MTSTHQPRTGPALHRRSAAAVMRTIGQRRPRPAGTTAHFVCGSCNVSWTGAEADCWACGRPATTEHSHPGTASQRLLAAVRPQPTTTSSDRRTS